MSAVKHISFVLHASDPLFVRSLCWRTLRRPTPGLLLHTLALWLASVLALCACATTPAPRDPALSIEVPASWSATPAIAAGDASLLAQWWRRFDDPLLASLVTQPLEFNTNVMSAQAALRQAWALRDVAAAALWPSLGGTAFGVVFGYFPARSAASMDPIEALRHE